MFFLEPSGPPNNANATSENSTSIMIIWEPLSREYQNGIIIGYTINLTKVGSEDISQHNSSRENITIGSLSPFTTYSFTVAAQTRVGTGPYTTTSTVMTSEDGVFIATLNNMILRCSVYVNKACVCVVLRF